MKKMLLTLFIVLGTLVIQAQEIKWVSLNEALSAQQKNPKSIFMDVYTDWCGPCKKMDKETFHDKAVVDYINANYYAVKFNAEGNDDIIYKGEKYSNPQYVKGKVGRSASHEFTAFLKVKTYPTMVIFNSKGDVINSILGRHDALSLIEALKTKS